MAGGLHHRFDAAQEIRPREVDTRRICLVGHSMGRIGTRKLAARYPDVWAALAPSPAGMNRAP